MTLNMAKRKLLAPAFMAASLLCSVGCGNEPETRDASPPAGGADAGPAPYSIESTLVGVLALDESAFVATPHRVELLNTANGEPLNPPRQTMTATNGKFSFANIPGDLEVWVHVTGQGPASAKESTYDSLGLLVVGSGENLTRVSNVGTVATVEQTGMFTARLDRVSVAGAVYRVDDTGRRIGTIGCAQIFLDDKPHPARDEDQRYQTANSLPTPLEQQDKTLARSGRFYFGNLPKGQHTFKASMDGGKTFIAERTLFIPFSRSDASGEFKAMLVLMALDFKGADPTPAGCPAAE